VSDSLFAQVAKNFTIVRVTGDDAHAKRINGNIYVT